MVKKMTVGQLSLKVAATLWCFSARGALPDAHVFYKTPELIVNLRVQIHTKPHRLTRTEDLIGPVLS